MSKRPRSLPESPPAFPQLAGWARSDVPSKPHGKGNASFYSGAALAVIDPIARSDHPIATLWRQRLALKCTAALMPHIGRAEGELEIRTHFHFARQSSSRGPAGQLLAAWIELTKPSALRAGGLAARLINLLDLQPNALATLEDILAGLPAGQGSPVTAAADVSHICLRLFPRERSLALWMADATLARMMRWPAPVPLIAAQIKRSDLRNASGAQDPDNWLEACHLAYAAAAADAADLYSEIARRAGALIAIAPQLRSKEADRIVQRLLTEDALSVEAGKETTDRSIRRLFDRLVELHAVRELTGRSGFRLYGI